MNWLEISIGIIFLICIITGLIRGAVRIIVSLVATIVTLVIVFFATPYVSQTIEKYTPLDDMIRQKVVSTMADAATSAVSGGDSYSDKGGLTEEAVKKVLKAAGVSEEKLESYGISIADIVSGKVSSDDLAKYGISANVLDGLKNSGNESVENAIENADIPESLQETLIKSADIPAAFKNLLLKNNNKATYQNGMLPVKRTIKNNKFLYRQPCYGWRYFMLLLYIAHDISLVSLHAVSFEVVGCCSNLCN